MKLQALTTAHSVMSKRLDEIVLKLQTQKNILANLQSAAVGERAYLDIAESGLRSTGAMGAGELSAVRLIRANHEGNRVRINRAIKQVEALILELALQRDELLRRCKAMELLVDKHHQQRQCVARRTEQRLQDEWSNLHGHRQS